MNKTVIFLFIATAILLFSIISVSVAPVINNIIGEFGDWGKKNCKIYADQAKYANYLDEKYKNERERNLCYRQNAMYGLEYTSFIIDLGIGFLCAQLALMHYFKIGQSFEKITGLIGLIGGAIGFILTLIYVCFSGYIFNNDVYTKEERLFSNGALYKKGNPSDIKVYSDDKTYNSNFVKYKDLGENQYNYNKKFYEAYYRAGSTCHLNERSSNPNNCEYFYEEPKEDSKNKYLYDRWCLSLVLAVFITICNVGLLIFGFLIFKNNGGQDNPQEVKIE